MTNRSFSLSTVYLFNTVLSSWYKWLGYGSSVYSSKFIRCLIQEDLFTGFMRNELYVDVIKAVTF